VASRLSFVLIERFRMVPGVTEPYPATTRRSELLVCSQHKRGRQRRGDCPSAA
jgi:hypothetical protein